MHVRLKILFHHVYNLEYIMRKGWVPICKVKVTVWDKNLCVSMISSAAQMNHFHFVKGIFWV